MKEAKPPIKICLFLPVWGRPEITRKCFENIERISRYNPAVFQITPFILVSEDWAVNLCREFEFFCVWVENTPLGRKVNEGLRRVVYNDFDWLMQLGADDFVNPGFLDEYFEYFETLQNFGITEVYLIEEKTGRQKRHTVSGRVFGALRCIRWDLVQQAAFDGDRYIGLWNDNQNRQLDFNSTDNIYARTGISTRPVHIETMLWDVKCESNINKFDAVEGERVHIPKEEMPIEIQYLCQ